MEKEHRGEINYGLWGPDELMDELADCPCLLRVDGDL